MEHILIDFENMQPESLDEFYSDECYIWLFLGKTQSSISIKLFKFLLKFKDRVQVIQLTKAGKNALDFQLTYYLGKITERDPQAEILIISKDCGYDSLIEHMREEKLCNLIHRVPVMLFEDTVQKANEKITSPEMLVHIHKKIAELENRPKKKTGIINMIKQFSKADDITAHHYLIQFQQKGWIKIDNNNAIIYHF